MKSKPPPTIITLALFGALHGSLSAASYSVTSVISETVGSTAVISGSGTKANTAIWTTGTVGRFIITDKDGNQLGLQVDATNPTGTLSTNQDSLMLAQTVNSQGLTDIGTLSLYVSPGNSVVTTGDWTLDLRFSFFDTSFTVPTPVDFLLTSLDIDSNQNYYTDQADFSSHTLYPGSAVTPDNSIAGYDGFTAGGGSSFNDPTHAVSSKGNIQSTFDVKLAGNNVALYMFEFRDPSEIVPEPSGAVLALVGSLGFLRRRRQP